LKKLCLVDDAMNDMVAPALTLGGVHEALQIARGMEELSLRFDATKPAAVCNLMMHPSAVASRRPSCLRVLDVCTSPLNSSRSFVTWLVAFHPSVEKVEYFKAFWMGMEDAYHSLSYRGGFHWPSPQEERVKIMESQLAAATMVDRWNDVRAFVRL
jgi:hypothetical protein